MLMSKPCVMNLVSKTTGLLFGSTVRNTIKRSASTVQFDWTDALNIESQLTEEEILMRDQVKSYCQQKLMPRIIEANRHEQPDHGVLKEMGELGFLGPTITG